MDYRDWGRGDLARHERRSADSWGGTGRDPISGADQPYSEEDDLRPVGRYRHEDVPPGQGGSDRYGAVGDDDGLVPSGPYAPTTTPTYRTPSRRRGADLDDANRYIPDWAAGVDTARWSSGRDSSSTRTPAARTDQDGIVDADRGSPSRGRHHREPDQPASDSLRSSRFTFRSDPAEDTRDDRYAGTGYDGTRRDPGTGGRAAGGRRRRRADDELPSSPASGRAVVPAVAGSDAGSPAPPRRGRRRAAEDADDEAATGRSGRFIDSKSWDTSGKRLADSAEIAQWIRSPDPDRKRGGASDIDRWWDRTSDPEEWARPARERLSRERLDRARLSRERPGDREQPDRSGRASRTRRGDRSLGDDGADINTISGDRETGSIFDDRDRDLGRGLDLDRDLDLGGTPGRSGGTGPSFGYGYDSSSGFGSSSGGGHGSAPSAGDSSSSGGFGSGSSYGYGGSREADGRYGGSDTGRHGRDGSGPSTRSWSDGAGQYGTGGYGAGQYGTAQYGTATADTSLWDRDRNADTGQWDRFTDTTEWDRSELSRIDSEALEDRYWSDREMTFWSGTRLAEDDPRWTETPASAPRSPAVAYPPPEREPEVRAGSTDVLRPSTDVRGPRYGSAARTSASTRTSTAARTGAATWAARQAGTARRGLSSSAIGSSRRRLEDDLLDPNPGGPLQAVLYSAAWYGVPVLVFLVWLLTLDPSVPAGCVTDVTGGGCESERARAMELVVNAAPRFGTALASSLVCAVVLRWWGSTWRAWSVGLAAAVVGGGISTVLLSVISGQPIGG